MDRKTSVTPAGRLVAVARCQKDGQRIELLNPAPELLGEGREVGSLDKATRVMSPETKKSWSQTWQSMAPPFSSRIWRSVATWMLFSEEPIEAGRVAGSQGKRSVAGRSSSSIAKSTRRSSSCSGVSAGR